MVKLILIILLLTPLSGHLEEHVNSIKRLSTVDKVFYQITTNKPDIDKVFAFRLAGLLVKYAKEHGMDPFRAAAIAMQESTYRKNAINKNRRSADYGMFQINSQTVREYSLDKKKLIENIEYSVNAYFQVMKDKKKLCEKLKNDAWSCYHSKTPSLRLKYKKLVNKYYHVNARKIAQWK
jgi:hypothetical protein